MAAEYADALEAFQVRRRTKAIVPLVQHTVARRAASPCGQPGALFAEP